MGKAAFKDPNLNWFVGDEFTEGDWVVYRPSDGWSLTLVSTDEHGGRLELLCRLLDDVSIRARINTDICANPADRVY